MKTRSFLTALAVLAAGALAWVSLAPSASTAGPTKSTDEIVSALATEYPRLVRQPGSAQDLALDRKTTANDLAKEIPELIALRGRAIDRNADRTLVLIPRTDGQACIAAFFAAGDALINCNKQAPTIVTYGKAVGVVPASVDQVLVTRADGSKQSAEIKGDLYETPADATQVSFVSDGTASEPQALMPAQSAPKGFQAPAL